MTCENKKGANGSFFVSDCLFQLISGRFPGLHFTITAFLSQLSFCSGCSGYSGAEASGTSARAYAALSASGSRQPG
ncbi:MAG: hypothetical protein CMI02_02640 [Oceanospirillaceae bacterium]|nr:hypothetical protein [Oceanospirillaceae bacterium]MBT10917.1 hypothetical protein [Oceanospirillaceae bacterium]